MQLTCQFLSRKYRIFESLNEFEDLCLIIIVLNPFFKIPKFDQNLTKIFQNLISGTDKEDDEDKSIHSNERAAIGFSSSCMEETTNENDLQVKLDLAFNIFLAPRHFTFGNFLRFNRFTLIL